MELKSNAERFLDAYAQLETKMASLAKETRYVPFSQLLSRLAPHNRIIANNQEELREYSELRNALVHMRGVKQEIIAQPCDSVVENIERIADMDIPIMTKEILQKYLHGDNVIVTSACVSGVLSEILLSRKKYKNKLILLRKKWMIITARMIQVI